MSGAGSDCIFCQIINGKIAADFVYENEHVVAFHDAKPVAPVHILIVPRKHIPTLNDIQPGDDILAHVGQAAKHVASMFGVDEKGYRFFINVNRGGGQVIFHLHAHVVSKAV